MHSRGCRRADAEVMRRILLRNHLYSLITLRILPEIQIISAKSDLNVRPDAGSIGADSEQK